MQVEIVGRRPQRFVTDPGQRPSGPAGLTPTLEVLVGDDSGARAVIAVPFDRRSVSCLLCKALSLPGAMLCCSLL